MKERNRGSRRDKKAQIKKALRAEWSRKMAEWGRTENEDFAQNMLKTYFLRAEGACRVRCPEGRDCGACSNNRLCSRRRSALSRDDEFALWLNGEATQSEDAD